MRKNNAETETKISREDKDSNCELLTVVLNS